MIALNGGVDGLDFYRCILAQAKNLLNPNGFVIMEIGDGQKASLEVLSQSIGQFNNISFRNDYVGTPRIVMLEEGSHG
jgi:release factor glutamine methyltransferase